MLLLWERNGHIDNTVVQQMANMIAKACNLHVATECGRHIEHNE